MEDVWPWKINSLKQTVFMPACQQTVSKGWLTCLRPQRPQTMWDAREKTVTSLMILDSWAESFTFSYWFLCLPQCPEEALGVPGSGCSPAVIAAVLCRSAHTSCGNMKNGIPLNTSSGNGRRWIRYVVCLHPVGHMYLTSPNVLAPFGLDIGLCVGSNRGSPKNQRWNRLGKLWLLSIADNKD